MKSALCGKCVCYVQLDLSGVRITCHLSGVFVLGPILDLYGSTPMEVSFASAPTNMRCFCAFRGDGNVHSDVISSGTVICMLRLTTCCFGMKLCTVGGVRSNVIDPRTASLCPMHF